MALITDVRVDIPEHSVLINKKENTYVQYTVKAYRNSKGQPTSKRVSIGKLDKNSGKLIPNRSYYKLFSKKEQVIGFRIVKKSGSYAVFSGIAEQLDLEKLVHKHFGNRAEDMLTVVHYMMCEGNVMFTLLRTTDFKKTTAEILDIYRRRDVIEKSFDSLKNDIDMKRLYNHRDKIAEGKTFVAFLALIIRSQIQNLLQQHMYNKKLTFKKVLLELDKAKLIIYSDKLNGCRLLNPPSKALKDILSLLSIDTDFLASVRYNNEPDGDNTKMHRHCAHVYARCRYHPV